MQKREIEQEKYIAGSKIKAWMTDLQMEFHINRWKKE